MYQMFVLWLREREKAVAFGLVAEDVAGAVGCRFISPVVVPLPIPLCVRTRCAFVAGFGLDLMAVCCAFERERERELNFSIELLHQFIHPLHLKSVSVNCYLCKTTKIKKLD